MRGGARRNLSRYSAVRRRLALVKQMLGEGWSARRRLISRVCGFGAKALLSKTRRSRCPT
jgi:hypothetical protein